MQRLYGVRKSGKQVREGENMPTSSITKKFIIKDDTTFENLIMASKKPKKRVKSSNAYEGGKKLLKQYLGDK